MVGEPCITVGDMNAVRVGARLIVWDETGSTVLTSGMLEGGTIDYDLTGPSLDDGGEDLFFFCSFNVRLRDIPKSAAIRFEYPGIDELGGTIPAGDITRLETTWTDPNRESERQRIRAEQG